MAGIVEVDEFLDGISPRLFRRWQAYFRVRDAEAWEVAGHIAAAAWNAAILTCDGSEKWKQTWWRDWEQFVPKRRQIRQQQKKTGPARTPEQDKAATEAWAGVLQAAFGPRA